jgi:hypothetical protein
LRSTSLRAEPGDVGREVAEVVRRAEEEESADRLDEPEYSHITPGGGCRHGQKGVEEEVIEAFFSLPAMRIKMRMRMQVSEFNARIQDVASWLLVK